MRPAGEPRLSLEEYLRRVDELLGIRTTKDAPPPDIPGQLAFDFTAVGTLRNPRL